MILKAIKHATFWLLSYLCAVLAATAVIVFIVFIIYPLLANKPMSPLSLSLIINAMGLSFFVALIAFVPAVLGSGIWEMRGYHPPIVLLAVLGAAAGTALPLWGALSDLPAIDAESVFWTVVFTAAGAAGGFTYGWCRRVFRPSGG